MTEEELREIELNYNREDIPRLIKHIRRLQKVIDQFREISK
jgi:hypothetical protein